MFRMNFERKFDPVMTLGEMYFHFISYQTEYNRADNFCFRKANGDLKLVQKQNGNGQKDHIRATLKGNGFR